MDSIQRLRNLNRVEREKMDRKMRGEKVGPVSFKRIFNSLKPIADSDQKLEPMQVQAPRPTADPEQGLI